MRGIPVEGRSAYHIAMADTLRLRIRLMRGEAIAVGPGKADLLEAVKATGSISAAARALGMSYKRAWYLLDTMNRCFKAPVIEAVKGGSGRGGARLTTMGDEVLALYKSAEARAEEAMKADLACLAGLLADTPEA